MNEARNKILKSSKFLLIIHLFPILFYLFAYISAGYTNGNEDFNLWMLIYATTILIPHIVIFIFNGFFLLFSFLIDIKSFSIIEIVLFISYYLSFFLIKVIQNELGYLIPLLLLLAFILKIKYSNSNDILYTKVKKFGETELIINIMLNLALLLFLFITILLYFSETKYLTYYFIFIVISAFYILKILSEYSLYPIREKILIVIYIALLSENILSLNFIGMLEGYIFILKLLIHIPILIYLTFYNLKTIQNLKPKN